MVLGLEGGHRRELSPAMHPASRHEEGGVALWPVIPGFRGGGVSYDVARK